MDNRIKTFDDVAEPAKSNPIVSACLTGYKAKVLDKETALSEMVWHMAMQLEAMQKIMVLGVTPPVPETLPEPEKKLLLESSNLPQTQNVEVLPDVRPGEIMIDKEVATSPLIDMASKVPDYTGKVHTWGSTLQDKKKKFIFF